jgi:hypothetical protein
MNLCRPVKKPGSLTVIKRTDVNAGSVWFVENHLYEKLAGPFKSIDEAYAKIALLESETHQKVNR